MLSNKGSWWNHLNTRFFLRKIYICFMLTSWVLTHVLSKISERVHTETSVIKGSGMYSYLTSDWSASDVRGCNGCDCGRIFIPRRFRSLFSRLSSFRSSWKNEVPFAGFWRQALRWILRPLLVLQMTLHFQQVTPSSIVVWSTFVSSSLLVLLAGWSVLPVFGIWAGATIFFSVCVFPLGLMVFVLPRVNPLSLYWPNPILSKRKGAMIPTA